MNELIIFLNYKGWFEIGLSFFLYCNINKAGIRVINESTERKLLMRLQIKTFKIFDFSKKLLK